MPRYFFHRTDGFVDHDNDGTELSDVDAARIAAVVFAGESMRDNPDFVWKGQDFRVEVTDQRGQLLMTIVTIAVDAQSTRPTSDKADA